MVLYTIFFVYITFADKKNACLNASTVYNGVHSGFCLQHLCTEPKNKKFLKNHVLETFTTRLPQQLLPTIFKYKKLYAQITLI